MVTLELGFEGRGRFLHRKLEEGIADGGNGMETERHEHGGQGGRAWLGRWMRCQLWATKPWGAVGAGSAWALGWGGWTVA